MLKKSLQAGKIELQGNSGRNFVSKQAKSNYSTFSHNYGLTYYSDGLLKYDVREEDGSIVLYLDKPPERVARKTFHCIL
ncbi:hypothetical protein [Cohnella candidum]|uniref:Uncharacterized protein n=1 Tax=Cohnella candidum TaxID=2674991 RepID=A0A3G3K417_9BACL|nr:hypothetical protein [Cohnella candidum]AYQ75182.1 hypothetical protein EAV92_23110 [Cohnella candidum]